MMMIMSLIEPYFNTDMMVQISNAVQLQLNIIFVIAIVIFVIAVLIIVMFGLLVKLTLKHTKLDEDVQRLERGMRDFGEKNDTRMDDINDKINTTGNVLDQVRRAVTNGFQLVDNQLTAGFQLVNIDQGMEDASQIMF